MTASGPQVLDPRVRSLWHLQWGLGALVVVVAAVVLGRVASSADLAWAVVVAGLVALAVVVAAIVVPRVEYRRWRWEVTDEGLEVSHGVVRQVQSAIPTFRVQQIDVRQGPLERAFGVVTLQITTASAASDGVIPGIAADRADAVRRDLLARLAVDDGV